MRIGLQLLLSYLLAGILIGYFVFTVLLDEIRPTIKNMTEAMLLDMSNVISKVIEVEIEEEMALTGLNAQQSMSRLNLETYSQKPFFQDELFFEVLDDSGALIYASNPSLHRHLDIHSKDVVNHSVGIFNHDQKIGNLVLYKSIQSVIELAVHLKNKIVFYAILLILALFLLSGFFIYLINRSLMRLIAYSKDLAEEKPAKRPTFWAPELGQLALALEEMKEKLDGKKYIENYIHTLTHELKSPLSSIIAATDILSAHFEQEEPKQSAMPMRYLNSIENQSNRMYQMIEKMLQLAKLDSRTGVSVELMPIDTLIKEAIENTRDEAQSKGIHLFAAQWVAAEVNVDAFLFKQALINLISNALDFTPKNGTVEIMARIKNQYYEIEVRDSGTGIPDYAVDKVMNKFYSLPRPNKGKSSGLGLSFVQEVAKLHHGFFKIKNREDGQKGVSAIFAIQVKYK